MKNKKTELKPFEKYELKLLITEEDKKGSNISKMSDFLGLYINDQVTLMSENSIKSPFPISDIGILNEVIFGAKSLSKEGVSYIPDLKSLPRKIRTKLKTGDYLIGESKQVEGNMRAVVVDKKGVRIKDITLKKVEKSLNDFDTIRNLANQIQLKNIQESIETVQQLQNYQLDKDRDRDIMIPFLDAREYILKAQNTDNTSDKKLNLVKASEKMITAINGVYIDIDTTKKNLTSLSKVPLLHKQSTFEKLMSYLASDVEIATKFAGVQMVIYNYLGMSSDAESVINTYNFNIKKLITEKVGKTGLTWIELLHDNTVYKSENMDYWYNFSEKMLPFLNKEKIEIDKNKDTYIVSLED